MSWRSCPFISVSRLLSALPSPAPLSRSNPMARLLARTLTLARPMAPPSGVRFRTSRALSAKVEFVEIDLSEESTSSSSGAGDSAAKMGMRRLEDAIHGVLVRRAAPDWLPFVPGRSYWVPPMPRPLGVADLLGAAVYSGRGAAMMTEEEAMCFTTPRGWPSSAYFVEGKLPHPVKRSRKDSTQTDDEES